MIQRLLPLRVRAAIRSLGRLWRNNRSLLWKILRSVKLRSLIEVFACLEDGGGGGTSIYKVWTKSRRLPYLLRRGSSDFYVFRQVVLDNQYGLPEIVDPKYIVDAGANVGLTSVVLLERYPECRIIAIEPDPQNVRMAELNLRSYGERCRLFPVALWSEVGTLSVQRGVFRDGLDWACQTVATAERNGASVEARTLNSLLAEVDFPRIDFLKVDVEGAELQVFGEGDTSFLEQTTCCATECHDDQCLEAFLQAAQHYGFSIRHEGELAIAWRDPCSGGSRTERSI